MTDMKVCPFCNNYTARPMVCTETGIWKYVCSRCHKIFIPERD